MELLKFCISSLWDSFSGSSYILHLFPCLSLSKDCFFSSIWVSLMIISSLSLLNLNGFLVDRTLPVYFLLFLPIEKVLLICLILSSFFYYSSITFDILYAVSWISDFLFLFIANNWSLSYGQYMLDHLNLFYFEKDRWGDTHLPVIEESTQSWFRFLLLLELKKGPEVEGPCVSYIWYVSINLYHYYSIEVFVDKYQIV